jgi:hypothetical protein
MSNQVYSNETTRYIDGQLNSILNKIPKDQQSTTLQISGPFVAINFIVKYTISDNQVYLEWNQTTSTSTNGASTSIISTALPLSIRPLNTASYPVSLVVGNTPSTSIELGYVSVDTNGIMTFQRTVVPPLYPNTTICGVSSSQILYTIS